MSPERGLDLILSIMGSRGRVERSGGDNMIAFMIFKEHLGLLCSGARVDPGRPIKRLLL